MKKGLFRENYIAEGHIYHQKHCRMRARRKKKILQPLFPLCSLISLLSVPPMGGIQPDISLQEQLGDAVCGSQLPRAQDRTEKDWSVRSQKENNQHKATFPVLYSWLVLFQILPMINVPNIHIRRCWDIVVKPGTLGSRTCVYFGLCSLRELSQPPYSRPAFFPSWNGDIFSAYHKGLVRLSHERLCVG